MHLYMPCNNLLKTWVLLLIRLLLNTVPILVMLHFGGEIGAVVTIWGMRRPSFFFSSSIEALCSYLYEQHFTCRVLPIYQTRRSSPNNSECNQTFKRMDNFFSFLIRLTTHNSNNGNTWMIKYGGWDSYETQSKDLIGDPHHYFC